MKRWVLLPVGVVWDITRGGVSPIRGDKKVLLATISSPPSTATIPDSMIALRSCCTISGSCMILSMTT